MDPGPPVTCKVPGTCELSFPIPESTTTSNGVTTTVCPGGPDEMAMPPRCILKVDVGSLVLSPGVAGTCGEASVVGTMKMRLDYLPMTSYLGGLATFNYSFQLGPTCGSPVWIDVPVEIKGNGVASDNGSVRFACDPLEITLLSVNVLTISDAGTVCGGGGLGSFVDLMKDYMSSYIELYTKELVQALNRGRACLDVPPGGTYPAPAPCLSTPCALGSACSGNDCDASSCSCGSCVP
jgi:hypothetical protein